MRKLWLVGGVSFSALLIASCGGVKEAEDVSDAADISTETPASEVAEVVVDASVEAPTEAPIGGADPANRNAYFGELHVHTRNSFDAYIFNVRTTPDDAYRFAKGETIKHPSGFDMTIGEPLDFQGVTDHAAYLGILPALDNTDHELNKLPIAGEMFGTDPDIILNAFQKVGATVRNGEPIEEIYDLEVVGSTWAETVAAANRHYQPGTFTTFAAYEYTSVKTRIDDGTFGGGNLHRNVVFRDNAPEMIFSVMNSTNPEDLWDWMDDQREAGIDVMSIPHNSNVSDGLMFDTVTYDGDPLTAEYAEQRMRNEPIVEMTQVKGTSETHPELSPNDEFADFGIYEELLGSNIVSRISGGYVREAFGTGMLLENTLGVNPYKFGLIGSSDSHVAGGAYDENDYWSKVGIVDGTAETRGSIPPGGATSWEGVEVAENADHWFSKWDASGLSVVWADENTRESIFDAMRRKETYATTGTRIKLRFFAGDYDQSLLEATDMVTRAYAGGVSMGGEVSGSETPNFLVWAQQDPRSAPLDRVQIVKVWLEGDKAQEQIYDAACADGRTPDTETGKCEATAASVNLEDCSYSTDLGAAELKAVWSDPNFDPGQKAAYYVRVLENPTCRWSTWDALKAGVAPNPDMPSNTVEERAWSSPIWYRP